MSGTGGLLRVGRLLKRGRALSRWACRLTVSSSIAVDSTTREWYAAVDTLQRVYNGRHVKFWCQESGSSPMGSKLENQAINLFFYGDEELIESVGYRTYEYKGSVDDAINFLRSRVSCDYRRAIISELDPPIPRDFFWLIDRAGNIPGLLSRYNVPFAGLPYCITQILNGRPRVDEVELDDSDPADDQPTDNQDYLIDYLTPDGLDFPRLLNDEFFSPVKILWNKQRYISSLKLLFSAIDTLSFIEYGPVNLSFILWLDDYCDLRPMGVTSGEVWELRNALLHMTNLDSHKVRKGHVRRLVPMVSASDEFTNVGIVGFFNIGHFLRIVTRQGLKKWLSSYNEDRDKFPSFVQRFDTIASEVRVVKS